jgi:hypothetical protein
MHRDVEKVDNAKEARKEVPHFIIPPEYPT